MRTVEETKAILNKLIREDKKHIKFFEDKYEDFEMCKLASAKMYFVIEGKYYLVKRHYEVRYDFEKSFQNSEKEIVEHPTYITYFFRVINQFLNLEDNNCTNWIMENLNYLAERVKGIYEKNKTCHIYQFKRVEAPTDNRFNKYITL